jgi:hypothetical protein
MFRGLRAEVFPPFERLELVFSPVQNKPADLAEVHLFTGVNGTGKTRILSLLATTLGNFSVLQKRLKELPQPIQLSVSSNLVGEKVREWDSGWQIFHGSLHQQTHGETTGWASRVPAFAYNGIAYVSDAQVAPMGQVKRPERPACLSFQRVETTSQELLQAITNLKVQAAMDTLNAGEAGGSETQPTKIVRALEATITSVTGIKFMFQVASYPTPVLEVSWGRSRLSFNLLPDGLRSIIGTLAHAVVMMDAWLQGKGNPLETEAVLLLDEIEGHLHPAWQRRILPAFQHLFPKAQIFVATHSPFVIASLNHGWIYPLTLDKDGKARASNPVPASPGDSYISVVEEIMGVKEWYDPETEQLLAEFRKNRDSAYAGDTSAQARARQLAMDIGKRSMELDYMMGRELSQMDRQLSKSTVKK